jgi:hypothetical protein
MPGPPSAPKPLRSLPTEAMRAGLVLLLVEGVVEGVVLDIVAVVAVAAALEIVAAVAVEAPAAAVAPEVAVLVREWLRLQDPCPCPYQCPRGPGPRQCGTLPVPSAHHRRRHRPKPGRMKTLWISHLMTERLSLPAPSPAPPIAACIAGCGPGDGWPTPY